MIQLLDAPDGPFRPGNKNAFQTIKYTFESNTQRSVINKFYFNLFEEQARKKLKFLFLRCPHVLFNHTEQ